MALFSNTARQQLEDGEIDETYDGCVGLVKLENGLVPSTDPGYNDVLANNDDFLPLPASKAIKSTFPPGCPVMTCYYNGTIASKEPSSNALAVSQILRGTVVRVGINLADDGNRETLYQVQVSSPDTKTTTTIIRQAQDLQFPIGTPVWLWNDDTDQYRPAIIVGSEHFPAFTDDHVLSSYVLYSSQVVVGNCKIYHGTLLDKLVYRSSEQPPGPTAEKAPTIFKMVVPSPFLSTSFTTSTSLPVATAPLGSQDLGAKVDDGDKEQASSVDDVSDETADEDSELEDGEIDETKSLTLLQKQPALTDEESELEDGEIDETAPKPPAETTMPSVNTTHPRCDNDTDLEEGEIPESSSPSPSPVSSKVTRVPKAPSSSSPQSVSSPKSPKRSLLSEFADAAGSTTSSDNFVDLMGELASPMASDNESVMDKSPDNIQATSYESSDASRADTASTPTIQLPVKTDVLSKSTSQTQLATESHKPDPSSHQPEEAVAVKPPTSSRDNRVVRAVNRDPSPFQAILFGADHQVSVVRKELSFLTNNLSKASQWWDVSELVCHRRCLEWQLNGRCWSNCNRRHDHVRLKPELANALEDALKPWMDLSGPIFCHPVTRSRFKGGNTLVGTRRTRQADDPGQMVEEPAAKRGKLRYAAEPSSKALGGTDFSAFAFTMHLPAFFGNEFLAEAIMGKDGASGKQLCDTFDCTINIELSASTNSIAVNAVQLTGSSRESLSKCQIAIEHALFQAVPPELREYMIFHLGFYNNYRAKNGDIVLTVNPDSTSSGQNDSPPLQYLTIIRSGSFNQDMLFSETDERTFQNAFRTKHPDCGTKLVKQQKLWPSIHPHVVVGGSNLKEVQNCRKSVLEWMANGHLA